MRIQGIDANSTDWPLVWSWTFAPNNCAGCTTTLVVGQRVRCMNCDGIMCGQCFQHDKQSNELLCRDCFSTD